LIAGDYPFIPVGERDCNSDAGIHTIWVRACISIPSTPYLDLYQWLPIVFGDY